MFMPKKSMLILGFFMILVQTTLISQTLNVKPAKFLRGWDPITIELSEDVESAGNGPLDEPGELFLIEPEHPGEFRWGTNNTIQFFPAEPWPALGTFKISSQGRQSVLTSMLAPPQNISPSPGQGKSPFNEIQFSFPYELETDQLKALIRIEIRPLPGVGDEGLIILSQQDFIIKALSDIPANGTFRYLLTFNEQVAYGKQLKLFMNLSLDPRIPGTVAEYRYETAESFLLKSVSMGNNTLPVSPNGSEFNISQAIQLGSRMQPIYLNFSERLAGMSVEEAKRLIQFEPAIESFRHSISRSSIRIDFQADPGVAYKVTIQPEQIRSSAGRILETPGRTVFYFYSEELDPFIKWNAGQAIVERFGPKNFPMEGRGTEYVDFRIYKIDPTDLRYWPFSSSAVSVNERTRPLMPGEEDQARSLEQQIKLLPSPDFSDVIQLPLREDSPRTSFGIDLSPMLKRIDGENQPGTYLIGYRNLDNSTTRSYVRVQVTDLSLSTIEEEQGVLFVVTSLRTGLPVQGSKVILEGTSSANSDFHILHSGTTNSEGKFYFKHERRLYWNLTRIRVVKDQDQLILNPSSPPPNFMNNHWYGSSSSWLSWLGREVVDDSEESKEKGYVFTERPIYRPEEKVYVTGFVRYRKQGDIKVFAAKTSRTVVIRGPGEREWFFEPELGPLGDFSFEFESEEELPSGTYTVTLQDEESKQVLDSLSFLVESYRVPRFEVRISGPELVRLDEEFELLLTAEYYAGGMVSGQRVNWNVNRYPYNVTPARFPGFLFSSDQRFSGRSGFQQLGYSSFTDETNEQGSAVLKLNPAQESTGIPIRYVIEATVEGADRMSVSTSYQVRAMPPFVIGVKHPRYLRGELEVLPEVLVLGIDEEPLAGQEYTMRVYHRQWHSYLSESDFTTGEAKYISDVVDVKIYEENHVSIDGIQQLKVAVEESGVYVIEILARDKLGRLQTVKTDFFLEGDTPVFWGKTEANVFETVPEKDSYAAGDTARLIIKSPYQTARALVAIEAPKENRYEWVDIENGQAVYELFIEPDMVPRVPVHILVMRGRVPGTEELRGNQPDRGRPAAMASTVYVTVQRVSNLAYLRLEHETKAFPGADLDMSIYMTDEKGNNLNGKAIVWLVDRAVLALGEERFQNPLDRFIDTPASRLRFRETRNLVVGNLPMRENPGGGGWDDYGESARRAEELLDQVTVRRNFQTVPYFNADVQIINGKAEIIIPLPDNLTDFAVRVVAVSGEDRFGIEKSKVSIRLPVIVQSAMPRFVRPGDVFQAGAIARVVEGEGGKSEVAVELRGMTTKGKLVDAYPIDLPFGIAKQAYFDFEVSPISEEGETVEVTLAVRRLSDNAMDAFYMSLPVRYSVRRIYERLFASMERGDDPVEFPKIEDEYKPATTVQSFTAALSESYLTFIPAMHFLNTYQYNCTEQRISRLFPQVALNTFFQEMDFEETPELPVKAVESLFPYLETALTDDGLYAFWPGSEGYVFLTAYVLEFLYYVQEAGITVPNSLIEGPLRTMKQALRSDYSRFVAQYSYRERVEALFVLNLFDDFDEQYAYNLLNNITSYDLYTQARLLEVFLLNKKSRDEQVRELKDFLIDKLVFDQVNRKKVFTGLQYSRSSWGGTLITSEVRTLSQVARALQLAEYRDLDFLTEKIADMGGVDGWGNTQSNVAAILAMARLVENPRRRTELLVKFGSNEQRISIDEAALTQRSFPGQTAGEISYPRGREEVFLLLESSFLPAGSGGDLESRSQGFDVKRFLHVYENGEEIDRIEVQAGTTYEFPTGTIIEEEVIVTVAEGMNYLAVQIPMAAGFEPLNPNLATAPAEAQPVGRITRKPTYSDYRDDSVSFYYNDVPAGTYSFFFRVKASFTGLFSQPPAMAEDMYNLERWGISDGCFIRIVEETE
jgi:uncharacterized protein YfaS (alpha-2-macroglobulin family)